MPCGCLAHRLPVVYYRNLAYLLHSSFKSIPVWVFQGWKLLLSIFPKEGSVALVHFLEAMLLNNMSIFPGFVLDGGSLSGSCELDEVFVPNLSCILRFPQGAPEGIRIFCPSPPDFCYYGLA